MPPARRTDERTSVPPGYLATKSAATLPIPVQLSVSLWKSMRANVIAAPRVSDRARWQLWTSTSSGSARASPRTCAPQPAASAACVPWPSPSSTPIKALAPPTSTAIARWPQMSWPGSGRDVAAHSIGPSRPWSAIVRNPLPHFDLRALPGCGFHDQPIHQPARPRQAEAQSAAGGIAVLHCPFDVGDTRAVVFGPYDQGLPALSVLDGNPDRAVAGVAGDVAGDFGDRGGDHGDIGQREAEVVGQLVASLAGGNDVVGVAYVDDDVINHRHVRSVCEKPVAGSAARGPPRGPARCPCQQRGCRAGPSRTPLRAAAPRLRCGRRAAWSCVQSSAATGRRTNPARRWQ